MNCEGCKYTKRFEELVKLFESFLSDNSSINKENFRELKCLLCANDKDNISGKILLFFSQLVDKNPYNDFWWYCFAEIAYVKNLYEQAENAYKKAILYDPNSNLYFEKLIKLQIDTNKFIDAVNNMQTLQRNTGVINDYLNYYLAKRYFNIKSFKEALATFNLTAQFSDDVPENEIEYYIAQCNYYLLNSDAAFLHIQKALRLSTKDKYKQLYADCLFEFKKYDEAAIIYKELFAAEKNPTYLNSIAACLSNSNDNDKALAAIKIYQEILTSNPKDTLVLFNYAKTASKLKDFDKAIELVERAIEIEPDKYKYYVFLTDYYYSIKNFCKCKELYLQAKKYCKEIDESEINRNLGLVLALNDEYEEALKIFLSVVNSARNLTDTDYFRLGFTYSKVGNYELAIMYLLKAIALNPVNITNNEVLAKVYRCAGKYNEAIKFYKKTKELKLNDYNFLVDFGNLYVDADRFEEAVSIYLEALSINKNDDIFNKIGWVYYCKKDYDAASKYFFGAIELKSDITTYKTNYILSLYKQNKTKEIFDTLTKKREIFNDSFSKIVYAMFLVRDGKGQDAISLIEKEFEKKEQYDLVMPFINVLKAYTYFYTGNIDKAIEYFENNLVALDVVTVSIKNFSLMEEMFRLLGICYLRKNKFDEAIAVFKDTLNGDGNKNAINFYNLGLAQMYKYFSDISEVSLMNESYKNFKKAEQCRNSGEAVYNNFYFEMMKGVSKDSEKKIGLFIYHKAIDYISRIKNLLKYRKDKTVYHYTKLSTLNELLKENGKLRMYNSANMNDPKEGKVFSKFFFKDNYSNVNISHSNVFLTSFSSEKDLLSMWVQYADDAKGCSIGIGSDFFDSYDNGTDAFLFEKLERPKVLSEVKKEDPKNYVDIQLNAMLDIAFDIANKINPQTNQTNQSLDMTPNFSIRPNEKAFIIDTIKMLNEIGTIIVGDRYCLHEVCYINDKQKSINIDPKRFMEIKENIDSLMKLYNGIAEDENLSDLAKKTLKKLLNELMDQIRYLFKSHHYKAEAEIRLVNFKSLYSKKIKEDVRKDDNIYRLYLDIDKVLQFEEIVLGSKVNKPEQLMPYYVRSNKIKNNKVTKSEIEYQ